MDIDEGDGHLSLLCGYKGYSQSLANEGQL